MQLDIANTAGWARDRSDRVWRWYVPAGLGVLGVVLVLTATARSGIGLSPDSAYYVSAARNLAAGKGFLCFDGTRLVSWAPLYSVILAVGPAAGLAVEGVARFVNATAFGLVVFLSGYQMSVSLRSRWLASIGALAVLLSFPLLVSSVMVWTEAVFAVLLILAVVTLTRFLKTAGWRWLVLTSIAAALACLQRYLGLAVVLGGAVAIWLLMRGAQVRKRLTSGILLLVVPVVPLAAWFFRNWRLTSTLSGERPMVLAGLGENLLAMSEALLEWAVPASVAYSLGWLGYAFVLGLFAVVVGLLLRRSAAEGKAIRAELPAVVVLGAYGAALALLLSENAYDQLHRLMAPIYPLVVLVVLAGVQRLLGTGAKRKKILFRVLAVASALWLLYPASRVVAGFRTWYESGVGVYDARDWQESPLVRWLRENPIQGRILSNDPAAVYLLTGLDARMSPRKEDSVAGLLASGELRKGDRIVWFRRIVRPYLYTVQELAEYVELEEEMFVGDGGVLVVN